VYGRRVVRRPATDDPIRRLGRLWNEERTGGREPATNASRALLRVFVEGLAIESDAIVRAVPDLVDSLCEEGFLERTPDGLRSTIRITRWRGLLIAHDSPPGVRIQRDIVLRPSPTTRTVAALTVRRRCRRALDVGTGCGALALLCAATADEVVATDVNPRALWFADLNARLNGIDNVRCEEGDLFEPVNGEQFDLVTANLPFVVSPRTDYLFRDGVRRGTADISERAVADASKVLAPDGFASLLVNWVVTDRESPAEEPLSWARDSACSVLILSHSVHTPRAYATRWAHGFADDVDEWVEYLDKRGAVAVAHGSVVLHRSQSRRIRSAQMSVSPSEAGGRQVERILRAPLPDGELLREDEVVRASRPTLVTPHTATSRVHRDDAGETLQPVEIRLDDTAGIIATVQPEIFEVIDRLDGRLTVDEAIAAQCNASSDALSTKLPDAVLRTVRALVLAGIMEH